VARALAPDGHVVEDGRIVADDLEPVAAAEAQHLARREQDRQRAEGTGHVKAAGVGGGHWAFCGRQVRQSAPALMAALR
jgi:hypothetical protein